MFMPCVLRCREGALRAALTAPDRQLSTATHRVSRHSNEHMTTTGHTNTVTVYHNTSDVAFSSAVVSPGSSYMYNDPPVCSGSREGRPPIHRATPARELMAWDGVLDTQL